MRRGWKAGVLAAVLAAVGAMVGGSGMYLYSAAQPDAAYRLVSSVPAVSEPMIINAAADMRREGWLVAAMKGPLTSTPYKVYASIVPHRGVSLPAWAVAAFPIRLPRFLLVVAAFALLGRVLERRVSRPMLLGGFTLGWVVFYGWFWLTHPG